MPMQMELSRIIINEINDQQVIYLREVAGERMFPILIGIFEATSIDRRVKDISTPRPLTHDLLVNLVETMGGEFQDVVISELREHTYYALLRVRQHLVRQPFAILVLLVLALPPLGIAAGGPGPDVVSRFVSFSVYPLFESP